MSYQRFENPPVDPNYSQYYSQPPYQSQPPPQQFYQGPPPAGYQQQGVPPYNAAYNQQPLPPQQQQYGYAPAVNPALNPAAQSYIGVPGHVFRGIWSDGLFDCFDSGVICLLSLFAPCVRWSMTVSRAKYLTLPAALALYAIPFLLYQGIYTYLAIHYPVTYGTNADSHYSDSTFITCMSVMMICHLATIIVGAAYRYKIRQDYTIPGNAVEDCCMHLCCQCCAIAQEARHIDRDLAIPV